MTSYKNKKVLITGASSGIGKELVKQFAKLECNIFITGRNVRALERLCETMRKSHPSSSVCFRATDLGDVSQIKSLIKDVRDTMGHIDILVNSAGIFPVNEIYDISIEEFQNCFNINVLAPFILTQEFCQNMSFNKWGRIINIGSSSAYAGSPKTSAYCASKHALLGLSRSLHKELKVNNVRVICVSPGSVQTPMGKKVEELGQIYETFMDPEEVSKYIIESTSYDTQMVSEEIRLNRMEVQ